jgi:hypothetical protein
VSVSVARIRVALGDGATEAQARDVLAALNRAGVLEPAFDAERIVGLAEFAEIMNRTPQAVRSWVGKPRTLVKLSCGPIWDRKDVEAFRDANPALCGVRA